MSEAMRFGLGQMFSLASRERCMTKIKQLVRPKPGIKPNRIASVLVPLCRVDNSICILYTVRSNYMRPNRIQQFTFPGGLLRDKECAIKTALRETEEIIGLSPTKVNIWGAGPYVPASTELAVTPVFASVSELSSIDLDINYKLISECFAVPVEMLCDPKNQYRTRCKNGFFLPVFMITEYKIWGITAFITHLYLSSILDKDVYDHAWAKRKILVDSAKYHS